MHGTEYSCILSGHFPGLHLAVDGPRAPARVFDLERSGVQHARETGQIVDTNIPYSVFQNFIQNQ